jgi:hypothetical protein
MLRQKHQIPKDFARGCNSPSFVFNIHKVDHIIWNMEGEDETTNSVLNLIIYIILEY